jgi:hypothetical protein
MKKISHKDTKTPRYTPLCLGVLVAKNKEGK